MGAGDHPWHDTYRPDRHQAQVPHGRLGSTATRSPGATPQRAAASGPTSSITPTTSCPGITGPAGHVDPTNPPWNCSTSVPHSPHTSTRSRPQSGRSSTTDGHWYDRTSIWLGATSVAARTSERIRVCLHRLGHRVAVQAGGVLPGQFADVLV